MTSRDATGLAKRLEALRRAVEIAESRFDAPAVATGRLVLDQAQSRLGLSGSHTVVAIAGGTGSGKSSLFNALAGAALSPPGVTRPTTSTASACIWPAEEDPGPLLDWLVVPRRHQIDPAPGDGDLRGLVLLDLPDFDSTADVHRIEVDRLINVVDAFIWVLDPQKYADAAVHDRYLKALAAYGEVTVVVLNHSDRLDAPALQECLRDIRGLLRDDGFQGLEPIPVSATTGQGVDDLRRVLQARVRDRRASVARLSADVDDVVGQLQPLCGDVTTRRSGDAHEVVAALGRAAGVGTVAAAAEGAYRMRARGFVGWPLSRWVRRFRPDPLRRLHLGAGARGRTSLPAASGAARAEVSNALRHLVDSRSAGMPAEWRRSLTRVLDDEQADLTEELDRAVAAADVDPGTSRAWWQVFRLIQVVALTAAVAGAVWLAVMAGVAYLQLPDPPLPRVGEAPLPTVMLLGGLVGGLLLSLLARPFVAVGASRARRRAQRNVEEGVGQVAERLVFAPAESEVAAHSSFCEALQRASR